WPRPSSSTWPGSPRGRTRPVSSGRWGRSGSTSRTRWAPTSTAWPPSTTCCAPGLPGGAHDLAGAAHPGLHRAPLQAAAIGGGGVCRVAGGQVAVEEGGGDVRFGYGTNGFDGHRLEDAVTVLAGLGYDGLALTLDHAHLDPFAPGLARRTARLADRLGSLGLVVVVETGARYLLDPFRKHEPTLLTERRDLRVSFLRTAVDVAADLGAEAVSFWSGTVPAGLPEAVAWDRLVAGCAEVTEYA